MKDFIFKQTSKLSTRLLTYFIFIITIMLGIIMYSLMYLENLNLKTNTTLYNISDIQTIVTTVEDLSGNIKSYYIRPDEKYYNDYHTNYKRVHKLMNSLVKENPNNHMYRDISAILESFYTEGSLVFSNIQKGEPHFYSNNLVISTGRLQGYITEECYKMIGAEIIEAQHSSNIMYSAIRQSTRRIYYSIFFVTLLCVFFAYHFSLRISQPISNLSLKLHLMANGDLSVRQTYIKSNDEINVLIESFNNMAHKLELSVAEIKNKSMIEAQLKQEQLKNIEMQHLLNQSELKFLQMQINPHFLFNTFNSISTLADIEDATKTKSMIDSLSTLLRYTVSKINNFVKLSEEIHVIENYLFIQKMRFGDRLTYSLNIPDVYMSYIIPSMILQPIVENSIIHGVEPKEQGGHLSILATEQDDSIIIIISDNGVGIDPDELSIMQQSSCDPNFDYVNGIGFMNVKRRLEITYGYNVLSIESTVNKGTTIKLVIKKQLHTKQLGAPGDFI